MVIAFVNKSVESPESQMSTNIRSFELRLGRQRMTPRFSLSGNAEQAKKHLLNSLTSTKRNLMQESKVWKKPGIVRALSLGTALSIVLQMTYCYAIAYADAANEPNGEPDTAHNVVFVDVTHKSSRHHVISRRHEQVASADVVTDAVTVPSEMSNAIASAAAPTSIEALGGLEAMAPSNLAVEAHSDNGSGGQVELASMQMPASTSMVAAAKADAKDATKADSTKIAATAPLSTSTTTTSTTSTTTTSTGGNKSIVAPSPLLNGVVTTETNDPVEKITRDALLKIFELERLNTYFRIESTRQSKWRKWRLLVSEEAAAIGVAAGIFIAVEQSLRSLHTGYKFHVIQFGPGLLFAKVFRPPGKVVLESAFITALPGVWFSVGVELFELSQNYFNDWKARQKGFDPKTTRMKAKQLQDEIDGLLGQRASLVASASVSQSEKDIENAEQKVLVDMRDYVVQEYINYYAGARRLRCYQNMFYWLDLGEKVTGVLSLQEGLESTRRNQTRILTSFGWLQLVSAALVELTPPVAKIYSETRAHISEKFINGYLKGAPTMTAEQMDGDRKHLQELYLNAGSGRGQTLLNNLMARDALYRTEGETYYALQAMKQREKDEARRAFKWSMIIRSIACASKLNFGIMGILIGDGRQTAPRHVTELLFEGTLPYEVALDLNIVDKFNTTMRAVHKENRLKANNELPGQIYRARLERLDQEQAIIAPGSPKTEVPNLK